MKAETSLTRHHLRCHFVLHNPRITVACNSIIKFHVKKLASKNSEFVARSVHKSVLSVHNTLTVEFHRTGLLHFPTMGYSLCYAARTERKEGTGLCQVTLTSPLCCVSPFITKAHKNLSYLFTSLTNSVWIRKTN